jgi:glycosyltransferase involved in cell wall biosynthesis
MWKKHEPEAMARIVYLHQYFTYPAVAGGSRSWQFVTRLLADGFEVTVLSSKSELNEHAIAAIRQELSVYGDRFRLDLVEVPYANHFGFRKRIQAFLRFAFAAAWKLLGYRQVDLVFATSTPLTIAIPALVRKFLRGTPFVFEVRDLWPELPIAMGALNNKVARTLAFALAKMAYHQSRHVVALSPGMRAGVMGFGIPESKVTEIPNACDNDLLRVDAGLGEAFLERHPELDGDGLVVYLGTLGRINGVGYLARLAAASQSKGYTTKFLVVGRGAEESLVRDLAMELNVLGKNFFLWEPLPKVQMAEVLSAATCATSLFVPVRAMEDNSANKFFDALAAARPVAINYGGWQKEVLQKSGAGICLNPHDLQEAAEQLHELLASPERLAACSVASAQLADEDFSRDHLYERLKAVFLGAVQ